MTDMPQVKLHLAEHQGRDVDYTGYQIEGWDEFVRWSNANLVLWDRMRRLGEIYHITETDRLHLLLYEFVGRSEKLAREFADYRMKNPEPVTVADGTRWRYVKP